MHKSEIKKHNGMPTLFIDGKPIPPLAFNFMSSDPDITNNIPTPPMMPSDPQLKAMSRAGVALYFIRIELRDPRDTETVAQKLERSVQALKKHSPTAYVMPWIIICPYEEFAKKHPNDLQTFDDGSVGGYSGNLSGRIASADTPRHTHASLAWRHETAGVIRKLIGIIRQTPVLDEAIAGFFFFPLHHEAAYYGDFDRAKKLDDYGEAMRLALKYHLAEKYAGNLDALRRAWKDDTVDFENFSFPKRAERENGSCGAFWNPEKSAKVIDYAEARSRIWADTLEYFARAVKEETDYSVVVGAFWGYMIHNDKLIWSGHGWQRSLIRSPFLDFWASPFHYTNKGPGMPISLRILERSLQMHGKLVFAECDTTTSTSNPTQRMRQGLIYEDASRDGELLKRDFIKTLTEGHNGWLVDWASGRSFYDEEQLLGLITQNEKIGHESLKKPMGSVAEIAAVIDQDSIFHVPQETDLTINAIEFPWVYEFPYLGAPIDHYELEDALKGELTHKAFVFQNTYLWSKKKRELLHRLRERAKMLIFTYAQGFLAEEAPTADAQNISELTGIRIKQANGSCSGRIVLTEAARDIGLVPGEEVGECDRLMTVGIVFRSNQCKPYKQQGLHYDPVFTVDDPDAIILGTYKDNGLPAFAMKRIGKTVCVYYGSAVLNASVLRALAKAQGLFLFAEEDSVIYANQSYLGVHAVRDGKTVLKLPGKHRLREVYENKVYTADQGCLPLDLKLGDTRLFAYED